MHHLSQIAVGLAEKDRPSVVVIPKHSAKKPSSARGSVHQTGLDSFLSNNAEAKPSTVAGLMHQRGHDSFLSRKESRPSRVFDPVADQDNNSVIVLDESDSSGSPNKRKQVEPGTSHQSADKKLRPN